MRAPVDGERDPAVLDALSVLELQVFGAAGGPLRDIAPPVTGCKAWPPRPLGGVGDVAQESPMAGPQPSSMRRTSLSRRYAELGNGAAK